MSWQEGRVIRLLRAALMGAVALAICVPALAGVEVRINERSYVVQGTTAAGLVRFMNGNALDGDHGHAYATIHPNYDLRLTTREVGGICRASRVDLSVRFDLVLPVAATPGAMSARTRSAWNRFAAFARGHEAHHRQSYVGCASSFVTTAKRQTAQACFALESTLRQQLAEMRRDCEAKQGAYDRSQARVLRNLGLFVLARSGR